MTSLQESGQHSELIIGLVNAVGTESQRVVELLRERLGLAGYEVKLIKISSDVIELLAPNSFEPESEYQRIKRLMGLGNDIRESSGDNSVLALGAATRINAYRIEKSGGNNNPLPKTVFIIDSLKRPEEVEQLRLIYPFGFILLAIHSEEDRRRTHLIDDLGMSENDAQSLIDRDGEESKVKHGQRLNDTFHLADFFVSAGREHGKLRSSIKRMVEIWFGNPFYTPTFDEFAMFMAFSAALRSADLSRQVGAVIARNQEILATGANDCPRPGGGLYWPDSSLHEKECWDEDRGRDYTREEGDSNRVEQLRIINQIVENSKAKSKESGLEIDEGLLRALLEESSIKNLTEYGRVVHAEMEALLSCARNSQSTVGTTMYATTFPCHNCAKHIVAAGLKRVVYVEPYAKSKALQFHDDSIILSSLDALEAGSKDSVKVHFEPFVGIGPRRFFDLFSMHLGSSYRLVRKDKNTGKREKWDIRTAKLRIQMNPDSYLDSELQACQVFGKLQASGNSLGEGQ
ncbi:cytidine deaminase [Blastopirellula marina]|uniref:Cytidine deaminase n=1 Tax=Blastopirellula marina TaxID=124 RepID=A0A2S8FX64_9BACT|nr:MULTISPECIES: anti-phage dCTP deaminase [Pirellulaceae]PQO36765.1 cytidine deaminase [Blastopirellula marina]RCS53480.1 cytidine deaminase [Bremerella cremea]